MTGRSIRSWAAVALLALLITAGCGARNDTGPSAAPAAPQAATGAASSSGPSGPGVTDDTITVGGSATLSGPTGFLGNEVFGAVSAYFQTVNAQGGVNGRKIKLITYDDRGESAQFLANVRKLVEQDKVALLITGFGDAAVEYLAEKEVPTITFGVSPATFSSKYPTVFPVVGNALLWTQETIAALEHEGIVKKGMRVGMIYDNSLIDVSPYVPFLKESWENAGATVVSTDAFTVASGSCDSLVIKMKDLDVDYWDFQTAAWFTCVQAADRQGWKPSLGWGGWPASVPTIATIAGPSVDGVWAGSNGDQPNGAPREETSATVEYVSAIKKYFPDLATPEHLESPAMLGYWAGAKLVVAALDAQGKQITQPGLISWIQGVKNFETGVTPPIISMAPDCKTGSEVVWVGQWHWDAASKEASRTPATGYFSSPQKEKFGGECFLTKISDDLLR